MSKPRYGWWGYAKYMVRIYPERKKELQDLQSQRITRNVSATVGSSETTRTTENAAIRQLSPAKQAEYDAVYKAAEATRCLKTGPARLALIDMVFWKKSHTLDGAAYALGYSYDSARLFQRDFLRLVGLYRGLMDLEESA